MKNWAVRSIWDYGIQSTKYSTIMTICYMITMEIDSGVVTEQRSKRREGVSKSDFFQTLHSLNSLTDLNKLSHISFKV